MSVERDAAKEVEAYELVSEAYAKGLSGFASRIERVLDRLYAENEKQAHELAAAQVRIMDLERELAAAQEKFRKEME